MTNLDSILKSRDITVDRGPYSQSYAFSSSHECMWELDHKEKAEHQRIDAFKLWCWTRCLRVFWATRRSNQSILKDWIFIGSSDTEAEAPILWPPDPKTWLIGKDLDAGKDWRQEEKRGRQRIRWLDDIIDTTDRSLSKLQEIVKDGMPGMLQSMGSQSQTASQSVQSLGHVRLFVTPWTAACQASLSITISWSLLKLMSIESVMPSNHLILCCPLLLLPSTFPNIRVFSNELALCIRWLNYWSFSFSISPFN